MSYQDAATANPAAIAAMLHYLSVDIHDDSPEAAEIIREAALELEALCRNAGMGAPPASIRFPSDVETALHA
jgi:hypothetical protein